MNIGKTLFAQLMDFLPWSTFERIVSRYGGDRAVRACVALHRAVQGYGICAVDLSGEPA